jgi:hypothetical protein
MQSITTSATLEDWQLLARGTDPSTGESVAYVGRRSYLGAEESVCVWTVVKRGSNWYTTGQWISGLNGYRECNDRKLSCSPLHTTIIQLAEA